jgi:predicted transposase/invertase (TIGR01784 family)
LKRLLKGLDKQVLRKGEREGKIEAARRMIEKGFDLETIAEITGLTREQVEKLR